MDGTAWWRDEDCLVLIVDDDRDIGQLAATILADEGFKVELRQTVDTALTFLRQTTPDLVIVDARLPFQPGRELLRAMRHDLQLTDLPVLLWSASAQELTHVLEAEADPHLGVLAKPFDLDAFLTILDELFKRGPRPECASVA